MRLFNEKLNLNPIYLIWGIITFFLISNSAIATEIRGLHITSTGNNKYESEIKANVDGMRRALSLVANSIGIKNSNFAEVPYTELKEVFEIEDRISEESYPQRYRADVTYKYDLLEANNLIRKYGSKEVKEQYFNYIIIPIFKQKNVISFLEDQTEWLKTWIERKEDASKFKLLPIDPTNDSSNITPENILSLNYESFLNYLKVKRFERVLIASCEYFTRPDGSMYFSVTTTELSEDEKNVTETRYDIGNPNMAKKYFGIAIDQIIAKYGQKAKLKMLPNMSDVSYHTERSMLEGGRNKKAGSVLDALLRDPNSGKKLKKIFMRADVFSKEGLKSFKEKLAKVPGIAKFKIDMNDFGKYIVTIFTDRDISELAEGFFMNDLSFREFDGQYVAFEVENGV